MKLIDAIVKSMEWSIKTKISKLHSPREACTEKFSSSHRENQKTLVNKHKLELQQPSSSDTRVTEYLSFETISSKQQVRKGNFFNLDLILRELQALRQLLKTILDDLDNLHIFHSKTYYKVCTKCRSFAYNDEKNQLEVSEIIDTLIRSLGINKLVQNYQQNTKNHCWTTEPINNTPVNRNNKAYESTDSSDNMSSTFSDASTNLHTETSNSSHTILGSPFVSKTNKSKHNFRCELILFLSMLQEVICEIFEVFCNPPEAKVCHDWIISVERQAQKLREEYFVILNYATELIHEPRCQLQKYHVKGRHKKIIVKLRINILISKKHIFEILYEICQLRRGLRHYQSDVISGRGNNSANEVPSISSQVLVKIQDICANLKSTQAKMPGVYVSCKTRDENQSMNLNGKTNADLEKQISSNKKSQAERKIEFRRQTTDSGDSIKIQEPDIKLQTKNLSTNQRRQTLFDIQSHVEALNSVRPLPIEPSYPVKIKKYKGKNLSHEAGTDSKKLILPNTLSRMEALSDTQLQTTGGGNSKTNRDIKSKIVTQKASSQPRKVTLPNTQSRVEAFGDTQSQTTGEGGFTNKDVKSKILNHKAPIHTRKPTSSNLQSNIEDVSDFHDKKIKETDPTQSPELCSRFMSQEVESNAKEDKSPLPNFNLNGNESDMRFQGTMPLHEKEHALLKKIYTLLDDYLKRTKGMDLERIKDFMEKETLKYSEELRRLCSIVNLTKLSSSNEIRKLKSQVDGVRYSKREPKGTLSHKTEDDTTECNYDQRLSTCMINDETQHIMTQNTIKNNFSPENQNKFLDSRQDRKLVKGNETSNQEKLECKNTCDGRSLDLNQTIEIKKIATAEKDDCSECCSYKKESLKVSNEGDLKNEKGGGIGKKDQHHQADCDNRKEEKVSNKELLRELKRLEMIVCCLQNESSKYLKQMKEKQVNKVKSNNPATSESNALKYSQTAEKEMLTREGGQFENSKSQSSRFHQVERDERDAQNAVMSSSSRIEEKEIEKQCLNNHTTAPIRQKQPPMQESLIPIQKNTASEEVKKSAQQKNRDQKLDEKNMEPSMIREPSKNTDTQKLNIAQYRSKSENDIKRISHCITLRTADCIHQEEIVGKSPISRQEILENNRYARGKRKEQMVQTEIRKKLSQKSLKAAKMVVIYTDKSIKRKRKNLRSRRSRIICNHVTQSETSVAKGHTKTSVKFSNESQQPIKSSYDEHYAGEENLSKFSLDVLNDWTTSSLINHSVMQNAKNSGCAKNYYDSPGTLCNNTFNSFSTRSQSTAEISTKKNIYQMNPDADYTSKKIVQNCWNTINNAKQAREGYFSSELQDQNLNLGLRMPKLKPRNNSQVSSNKNSFGELAERESKFSKILKPHLRYSGSIDTKTHHLDTFEIQRGVIDNNDTKKRTEQNLIANKLYSDQDELAAIFSFDDLMNMRDKHDLFKKIKDGDKTENFSSESSKNSMKNYVLQGSIQMSERHSTRTFRDHSESISNSNSTKQTEPNINLPEKSKITVNTEYTKVKLDSMSGQNLVTGLLLDGQILGQSHEENKELLQSLVPKTTFGNSNGVSEPLTSFYFDCVMNTTKKENIQETEDIKYCRSEPNSQAKTKVSSMIQRSVQDIDGIQPENTSKKVHATQILSSDSLNKKKLEKNKRPKAQFKARRSTISIKSATKLKQFVNLAPSPVETMTQFLYPKAQLTIFLKNKRQVEELCQEPCIGLIKYHDLRQRPADALGLSNTREPETLYQKSVLRHKKELLKKNIAKARHQDKIIDAKREVKNLPIQLYDYNGLPLTNSNGEPLKNAYGEVLVIFDENGAPISDNHKNVLFDSRNKPSTSHKFNPFTPSKNNPFKVQLTNEQGKPLVLYNEDGHPVTDEKGYSLFDIDGNPLIRFDSCGRPVSDCKGNPLHTPSKRDIQQSDRDTRKCEMRELRRVRSPPRNASILPRQCTGNMDNDTHCSLACISSTRTIDDFLEGQSWTGREVDSDQMDLISLVLTNDCSISSKSSSESECDKDKTRKLKRATNNLKQNLLKQQLRFFNSKYEDRKSRAMRAT